MKAFLKTFGIIYIPIALVLYLVFSYSASVMVQSGTEELLSEMKNMWQILSNYENEPEFQLNRHHQIKKISLNTTLRITLIEPNGVVVDDSYVDIPEISSMENHASRPEVAAAMVHGEGHAMRFSHTVKEQMLYYARKLPNNMILRIAYPMTYVTRIQSEWRNYVMAIMIFLLIATGLITLYLANRISRPLKQLDDIAGEVEKGALDVHFPDFSDPTMSRISGLIYRIYHSMLSNQEKLHDEQTKLNQILATMEEAILLIDPTHTVIHANTNIPLLLGIDPLPGKNLMEQIDNAETLAFFRNILQSDETYFSRVDLGTRFFEIYVRKVEHDTLLVFHDISERGRYDVFKSELIGNITHELKTPMASIMGYAETLLANPNISEEESKKFLTIILNHTQRLNDLIADLLELHKLENRGKSVSVSEPVDFHQLVDELQNQYESTEKSIQFNVPDGTAQIRHEHMASLLTNLIDNAIRYSTEHEIRATITQADDMVTISVSDNGPVIPLSQRKRIFERFYTVSKSRNRANAGTGLGLSIVKHIAGLYGGHIELTENSQGGNTFTVKLVEIVQ